MEVTWVFWKLSCSPQKYLVWFHYTENRFSMQPREDWCLNSGDSTPDSQLPLWHGTKNRAWLTTGTHKMVARRVEEVRGRKHLFIGFNSRGECGNLALEFALFYVFLVSFKFSVIWKYNSVKCIAKHRSYIRQDLIFNLIWTWLICEE